MSFVTSKKDRRPWGEEQRGGTRAGKAIRPLLHELVYCSLLKLFVDSVESSF